MNIRTFAWSSLLISGASAGVSVSYPSLVVSTAPTFHIRSKMKLQYSIHFMTSKHKVHCNSIKHKYPFLIRLFLIFLCTTDRSWRKAIVQWSIPNSKSQPLVVLRSRIPWSISYGRHSIFHTSNSWRTVSTTIHLYSSIKTVWRLECGR